MFYCFLVFKVSINHSMDVLCFGIKIRLKYNFHLCFTVSRLWQTKITIFKVLISHFMHVLCSGKHFVTAFQNKLLFLIWYVSASYCGEQMSSSSNVIRAYVSSQISFIQLIFISAAATSYGDLNNWKYLGECSKTKLQLERTNYRPQTRFAKVMFLQVSVCPRGEYTPHRQVHPSRQVHLPGQVPT